jgi:hypothetical protein
MAGRVPARHAHTCHAPSGFAAGVSRPLLGPTDTPVSLGLFAHTASHPRPGMERGMHRGLCCVVGPVIPPPTPTPAHGTHCPPFGRFAASAFCASGNGAAPSALAAPPRQCPARFNKLTADPLPSVHSPLHLSNSALCSARCYAGNIRRS